MISAPFFGMPLLLDACPLRMGAHFDRAAAALSELLFLQVFFKNFSPKKVPDFLN